MIIEIIKQTEYEMRIQKGIAMKTIKFRLSALLLALVMLLTVLVGCNNPSGTVDNGGNSNITDNTTNTDDTNNSDNNDDSTVTEPIQIKTTIYEIAKHGNLILYMYGSELFDKGFEHGDVVEIAIGDKKWDVPLCTSYSDVDNGVAVLRATAATDGVVLAINMGDFATTAGIATKTAIEEEPGYRWDYLMDSPVEITITMKEEGGYREEWLIRQLVRTNERTDYANLSDEAFANFRVINTTGMGKGVLYRSSSPINPALGRNTYADKAAENAGILTIVNLADPSNTYDGTESTYYSTCQVVYVNLGMDFLSEATLNGIAEGMRHIINNNGPYLIHCNEGKDRAGFISSLLECLMGATLDEVIDDYMLTYYNYYGVEEGSEKYDAIVKNNLIKVLNTTFKVDDVYKADLAAEAVAFLTEDAGLTADEVTALKAKLTISLNEVYEAGSLPTLLEKHDSVYVQRTENDEVYEEEYFSKEYSYTFYSYTPESEYAFFLTNHSYYMYFKNMDVRIIILTPDGMIGMESLFAEEIDENIFSENLLNDTIVSVTEKDGKIIVRSVSDSEELAIYEAQGWILGEEDTVLDAKTREVIFEKASYTKIETGETYEGATYIIYDGDIPESMKKFVEYDKQTDNLRIVTIVSNPGAENEKTESIQVPKGLQVAISDLADVEEPLYTLYADAACTQTFEGEWDVNSDITIYVKWGE